MKIKFFQQFSKNPQNVQVHENPSSGNRVVPFGWTYMMNLSLFTILQMCIKMRICVGALACVPFVIKHILLQNFVSAPTQVYRDFGFSGCK